MIVKMYKCRFTGKLFTLNERKQFIKHLKSLRNTQRANRELKRIKRTFAEWLAAEKEKIVSIDMLTSWIIENQQTLMKAFNAWNRGSWDGGFDLETDVITKITLSVRFSRCVSNTHVSPKNGVTNWGCKEGLPYGYPGYHGRIEGSLTRAKKNNSRYPMSDFLKMIDIHTGSGGGGNENCGWSVSIFIADWPQLAQEETMKALAGKKTIDPWDIYAE